MGAKVELYTRNILETGTVTVTGTADAGYPEERLHDRGIDLYWIDTVTEAKVFHVDQGASGALAVDTLIVAGHNFDTEDIAWQHSTNDSDWTDYGAKFVTTTVGTLLSGDSGPLEMSSVTEFAASGSLRIDDEDVLFSSVTDNSPYISARGQNGTAQADHDPGAPVYHYYSGTWTQSGSSDIVFGDSTAATKRYWRFTVTSMANPKASEIFMSYGYQFGVQTRPNPALSELPNVVWNRTVGNNERSTKFGDARRVRQYGLYLDADDLANWRLAMADLDGYSKPFWIKDHEQNFIFGRLDGAPAEDHGHKDYTTISFVFTEVL